MTDTERWVSYTCERIVASGHVWLYKDLYRDLRERLPCGVACRLIAGGLWLTRQPDFHENGSTAYYVCGARARAMAALKRLERYAGRQEWWQGVVLSADVVGGM